MPATIATSTAVDLSRLPAPDVIEALDFETILQALKDDLAIRLPEFDEWRESDPAMKLLEIVAYREMVLRQRVNDAGRALLLAYAGGSDLDNLGALFGVTRRELEPANPATGAEAVMEADADLRRRLLQAPDAFSVAGPRLAYVFHALSADGDVLDAAATSPNPGEVVVSVLSRQGDGTASTALLEAVETAVAADDVRPLTDAVTVQSADIVTFTVEAELTLFSGPDPNLILETAQEAVAETLQANRRIGRTISRSALIAALHGAGVQNVDLIEPQQDVPIGETEAAWADDISISIAGYVS